MTSQQLPSILVTGGSGFVGGYVLTRFREAAFTAFNFDLHSPGCHDHDLQGSILDVQAVERAVSRADVVFHFAGFSNINLVKDNPRACLDLNVMGTANILEALRKKGNTKLVFASSVYAGNEHGHLYTTSKKAAERICADYSMLYGIPVAVIRLGTVYGERSRQEDVVSIFARKAAGAGEIVVHGSGSQTRNFIHGEDVATACVRLAIDPEACGTFILASAHSTSIRELATLAASDSAGSSVRVLDALKREDDYLGDELAASAVAETYRRLDWEPSIDIQAGMQRMVEAFKTGSAIDCKSA